MTWLTLVLALAAVASAVFAYVQAKSATDSRREAQGAKVESEKARDEAVWLAKEANTAFVRQAEAQERANELAEAAMPVPEIAWTIRRLSKSRFELVNTGDLVARNVTLAGVGAEPDLIQIDSDEALPRDVGPGDGVAFFATMVMGPDPKLRAEWEDSAGQRFHAERTIR